MTLTSDLLDTRSGCLEAILCTKFGDLSSNFFLPYRSEMHIQITACSYNLIPLRGWCAVVSLNDLGYRSACSLVSYVS